MEIWTLAEYKQFYKTGVPPGKEPEKKQGRVKGNKILIDDHWFYIKEGQVYVDYKLDPLVTKLEIKPKFTLQDKFNFFGKKLSSITYESDFKIEVKGIELPIVVEVKSVQTGKMADYSIRKRLFLKHILDKGLKLHFLEITFNGNKRSHKFYKYGLETVDSPFLRGIK